MKEIWKDIKDYEGLYQVSNLGRVKSLARKGCLKDRFLKLKLANRGYLTVNLHKESKQEPKRVHQLVAIAFLNHTPCGYNGLIVDHRNNDKLDNRLENLQLITNRENSTKDRTGGTSEYVGVSWKTSNNKWQANIQINGKRIHLGYFKMEYTASIAYQTSLHNHLNKQP